MSGPGVTLATSTHVFTRANHSPRLISTSEYAFLILLLGHSLRASTPPYYNSLLTSLPVSTLAFIQAILSLSISQKDILKTQN